MTSPTAAAVSGPSGRNQVTVQFIAPSMARAMTAGSMSTSSPDRTPSVITRRSACSYLSRFLTIAARIAGGSDSV